MNSKGQKDEKSIDLKIWSVQCPNSFSASTPSFWGVPEFGWKNGTQNSMAKTRFFGWDTNPPILPPFYVLSCGTRIQASPVVIRWCDGGWLDKTKHKNTTWTQRNSSEKLSYTIIQSEFKKMSHLQKIHILQKKKKQLPPAPQFCVWQAKFSPKRLGKFFSSQATMRSRLRHPVCPVRWSSSWSVGETPTPQTYSSPRSVGLGKWCFGPKKIPRKTPNTQRIKWNINAYICKMFVYIYGNFGVYIWVYL